MTHHPFIPISDDYLSVVVNPIPNTIPVAVEVRRAYAVQSLGDRANLAWRLSRLAGDSIGRKEHALVSLASGDLTRGWPDDAYGRTVRSRARSLRLVRRRRELFLILAGALIDAKIAASGVTR